MNKNKKISIPISELRKWNNELINHICDKYEKKNNKHPSVKCNNLYGKGKRKGPYCRVTKGTCKCYSIIPKGNIIF